MHDFDTALEPRVKKPFPAAASKDLGLDDQVISPNFLCDLFGLQGRSSSRALGGLDSSLSKELHGEILVNREGSLLGLPGDGPVVTSTSPRDRQTLKGNRQRTFKTLVPLDIRNRFIVVFP